MNCLIFRQFAVALSTSFCLALAVIRADEPDKAETPKQSNIEVEQDLELQHSRVLLRDQIDRFALLDAHVDLVQANGLGIDVGVPDAALKAQLNLPDGQGLTITQVPEDSIGAKAGLKVHDIIVEVGDQGVNEPAALGKLLEAADGKSVKLRLWRAGKRTEVEATPKKPELAKVRYWDALTGKLDRDGDGLVSAEHYRIGVTLSESDETLRQQLRLAAGEGLVVTEVVADSAAAKAGIQTHDVLTVLDGKRLTTVEAINAQIQEVKDNSVELRLLRGGKEMTIQIAPRKTQEAAFVDRPLVYWDTKSCRSCHADAAHNALGWKLGANVSAWTDGHHSKLYQYEDAYRAQIAAGQQQAAGTAGPQQQIEALKTQLAEMQKTLATLERTIQQPAKEEENR
jgi:hypothetical protein